MEDDFKDLQALLRLKRYEAPPAEYFEDFLYEFHRRQRAELLRRPLWRLALDRLEGALPTFTPARYAYVGSCAVAAVVAVAASGHILIREPHTARGSSLALVSNAHAANPQANYNAIPRLALHDNRASVRLPELNFDQPRQYTAAAQRAHPRYVLDTQPVSYEPSSSF